MSKSMNLTEICQVVEKPEFKVVGIVHNGTFTPEDGAEMAKLWQAFPPRIVEIQNQVHGDIALGVYHDRPPADYTYYAAVEVSDFDNIPSGMDKVVVPSHRYAVFTHKGPMNTFGDTMNKIYSEYLPALGYERDRAAMAIEVYDGGRFNPVADDSEVDVYIPIV